MAVADAPPSGMDEFNKTNIAAAADHQPFYLRIYILARKSPARNTRIKGWEESNGMAI